MVAVIIVLVVVLSMLDGATEYTELLFRIASGFGLRVQESLASNHKNQGPLVPLIGVKGP